MPGFQLRLLMTLAKAARCQRRSSSVADELLCTWFSLKYSWNDCEFGAVRLRRWSRTAVKAASSVVAASLTGFSLTARLAFMVVGPMVDVKLIALQAGTFGRRFALRFAPLTLVVAVGASVVVGGWLL